MKNSIAKFWDWEQEWKTVFPTQVGKEMTRVLGKCWEREFPLMPDLVWSRTCYLVICAPNAPCRTFLAPCCIFTAPCHTFLAPCHTFSAPCPMPKITCNFWCFSSSFSLSCFIPFSPFLPVNSLNFTKGVWHRLPWHCYKGLCSHVSKTYSVGKNIFTLVLMLCLLCSDVTQW